MGAIANAKILAEIADIGSRIYGVMVDKSRAMAEKNAKIKELEKQVEDLKAKLTK